MSVKLLNLIARGNVTADQKQCGIGLPGKYTAVWYNHEEVICWCINSAFQGTIMLCVIGFQFPLI